MSQDLEKLKIWAAVERIDLARRDLEGAREVLERLEEQIASTSELTETQRRRLAALSALEHLTQAYDAAQLAVDVLRPLLDTTVEGAP